MEAKKIKWKTEEMVKRERERPVTQDIQTESWFVERETEICSGFQPWTVLWTRGSVSGKSMACPRKILSRGTVTGLKGPSSVVGIAPLKKVKVSITTETTSTAIFKETETDPVSQTFMQG